MARDRRRRDARLGRRRRARARGRAGRRPCRALTWTCATPRPAWRLSTDGDVVLNAAAWTDVDGAEGHEAEAFAVNAVGAANLARRVRQTRRRSRARLHRLRLRRGCEGAVPRRRAGGAARCLRAEQGRRRVGGRGHDAPGRTWSGPPGCTASTAAASRTRCCAWPASGRSSGSSTTSRGSRPGRETSLSACGPSSNRAARVRDLPRRLVGGHDVVRVRPGDVPAGRPGPRPRTPDDECGLRSRSATAGVQRPWRRAADAGVAGRAGPVPVRAVRHGEAIPSERYARTRWFSCGRMDDVSAHRRSVLPSPVPGPSSAA